MRKELLDSKRASLLLPFLLVFAGLHVADSSQAREKAPSIEVQPELVEADLFYDGADVMVRLTLPSTDTGAALVLRGPAATLELKRIGKALGLLWMKTGEVTLHNVPVLYMVRTAPGWPERALSAVGYEALYRSVTGDTVDEPTFREFVKLKEKEGTYLAELGALSPQSGRDASGQETVVSVFHLPAKAPEGAYRVELYLLDSEGQIRLAAETEIMLERTGVAAFLASLALNHGFLYGILSVMLALVAGLVTGKVFSAGSKSGH